MELGRAWGMKMMVEEQRSEAVSCPECGVFATLHLEESGHIKTELGDVSNCRHGLIGTAVLACSGLRPGLVAGQKRLVERH